MRAIIWIAGLLLAAPALAEVKAGADARPKDDKVALDRWRAAADKGNADALFQLGQAYRLGRGVPVDTGKARDYYRQATAKGHAEAADNYGLALFQTGKPREAIPYLEKASDRGDRRAQYVLGTMLFNGVDIRKDWVRAYALLTRSARSGLPQATNTLAQMDRHIPIDQRRQGIALAARIPATRPSAEVAGSASVVRRVDPAKAPVPRPAAAPGGGEGWRLQLGAFGDAGNARKLGAQMAGRFPGRTIGYVPVGALTRVLVGPFPSRTAALAACGSVTPCVPVGP